MAIRILGRLSVAVFAMSLCETGFAATRGGTTSVAIHVERHTGLYLPASDSGFRLASQTDERLPSKPAAFGNSQPSLVVSGERPEALSRASSRGSAPRVVVTVFEP